jgi:hypothetical protein
MSLKTMRDRWVFRGSYTPGASAGVDPWLKKDTSSSGSPTMTGSTDGLKTTLAATNEIEVMTFYHGDVLAYDIDDIIRAEFVLKANTPLAANETLVVGLASNQADDPDAIAANAWFKIVGAASANTTLLCESDDGTTDNDDKETGLSLGTSAHKRLVIDFSTEVQTRSPPFTSKGKQAAFFIADANNMLRRVADNVAFDMSGYSSGLQPFLQLQKASGTGVPAVSLLEVCIEYRLPA